MRLFLRAAVMMVVLALFFERRRADAAGAAVPGRSTKRSPGANYDKAEFRLWVPKQADRL
jgi:hypothetical protein